jgi:hypothetical protein
VSRNDSSSGEKLHAEDLDKVDLSQERTATPVERVNCNNIHKNDDKSDCSYQGISLLSISYKNLFSIPILLSDSKLIPYADEITGDHQCGFRLMLVRQRLIIFSISVRYLRKRWECNGTMYQLFVDFKKAYDSVKMKMKMFIEFGITRKPVWLIKMCLNETYTTVIIGKNMSDRFPIQNDLKKETLYHY